MFHEWSFDFIIEMIGNNSFHFQIGEKNNQIEVHVEKITMGYISVSVFKRSEDFKVVGEYLTWKNKFERDKAFFEVMFSEHLVF